MPKPTSLHLAACVLCLIGALQAWGQAVETVVIANQPVARIRATGPFGSLAQRSAAIDKAICEVISTQDTQHPKVAAKQSHGVWYVYSGTIKVMGVYDGDAKPNGVATRDLAVQWANNVREMLPRATPLSRVPRAAIKPKPGPTVAATPGAIGITPTVTPGATGEPAAGEGNPPGGTPATPGGAATPATGAATPATGAATPATGDAGPTTDRPGPSTPATTSATGTTAGPTAATTGPKNASLLLILDSFNVVRNLSQDDYLGKRDEVASNLLANLSAFGVTPPTGGGATSVVPTPSWGPLPPLASGSLTAGPTGGGGSGTSAAVVKPKPKATGNGSRATGTVKPPKPPPAGAKPPTLASGGSHAGDPAYAKVPQKNRIKAKMNQCQVPLEAARTSDPTTADQAYDLIKAARTAFAAMNYDVAEEYVDHAMKLLGIAGEAVP